MVLPVSKTVTLVAWLSILHHRQGGETRSGTPWCPITKYIFAATTRGLLFHNFRQYRTGDGLSSPAQSQPAEICSPPASVGWPSGEFGRRNSASNPRHRSLTKVYSTSRLGSLHALLWGCATLCAIDVWVIVAVAPAGFFALEAGYLALSPQVQSS